MGMGRATPYDVILAASAARTADPTLSPPEIVDTGAKGVIVVVRVTNAGTGSITAHIEGWDAASDTWYPILSSAALNTNATTAIAVYPGANAVANSRADLALPRRWRVRIAHGNANSITYSVGAAVL